MYPLARQIGHRGLAAHAPENTLAGIRCAHKNGFKWVEFDVRLSADNVAVLSHDASLSRCGGIDARIHKTTAARLAALPVNCGFDNVRECVPSLAATFDLLRELKMGAVVEIKPQDGEQTAAAIVELLPQAPSNIMVSSFSMAALLTARKLMPNIARAVNCNLPDDGVMDMLTEAAADNLHCGVNSGRTIIQKVAAAGYGVYCFTADDDKTANPLFAAGAHGVFTNTGVSGEVN